MGKKDQNNTQAGVIHLAVPILALLALIIVAVIILYYLGVFKQISLPGIKKEPTVSLQNQYQNPFDQGSQYVNPFSSYQNPFDQLK